MAAASAPVSLPASDVGSSLASAATGSPVPGMPGVCDAVSATAASGPMISAAVPGRFAGSFSSSRAIRAARSSGTSPRSDRTGVGSC